MSRMNPMAVNMVYAGMIPPRIAPSQIRESAGSGSAAAGDGPQGGPARFSHKRTVTIVIDLSVARTAGGVGANAPMSVNYDGSFIHCPWSTNSDDLAMVRFDDDGDPIPVTRHYSCSGNGYSKLTITNAAIAGATMYLVLCLESKDERLMVL